jgi:NAD-dependent deacetylase
VLIYYLLRKSLKMIRGRVVEMKIETDERVIAYIRRKIRDSKKIVAFLGVEMLVESGGYDLDSNEEHYRVEDEYGYSPEDMLTNSFFNSKPEKFYKFYKKEILGMNIHNCPAYEALMKLEAQGKLGAVITQNYHGLPEGVHFRNFIELNGSIYRNKCSRCGMHYDINYVKGSHAIPLCDNCKTAIRPDIRLLGERANAKILTDVANVCENANIVMFLGSNIYNERFEFQVNPEDEQIKILFTKDELAKGSMVDFVIRDDISTFLPLVLE